MFSFFKKKAKTPAPSRVKVAELTRLTALTGLLDRDPAIDALGADVTRVLEQLALYGDRWAGVVATLQREAGQALDPLRPSDDSKRALEDVLQRAVRHVATAQAETDDRFTALDPKKQVAALQQKAKHEELRKLVEADVAPLRDIPWLSTAADSGGPAAKNAKKILELRNGMLALVQQADEQGAQGAWSDGVRSLEKARKRAAKVEKLIEKFENDARKVAKRAAQKSGKRDPFSTADALRDEVQRDPWLSLSDAQTHEAAIDRAVKLALRGEESHEAALAALQDVALELREQTGRLQATWSGLQSRYDAKKATVTRLLELESLGTVELAEHVGDWTSAVALRDPAWAERAVSELETFLASPEVVALLGAEQTWTDTGLDRAKTVRDALQELADGPSSRRLQERPCGGRPLMGWIQKLSEVVADAQDFAAALRLVDAAETARAAFDGIHQDWAALAEARAAADAKVVPKVAALRGVLKRSEKQVKTWAQGDREIPKRFAIPGELDGAEELWTVQRETAESREDLETATGTILELLADLETRARELWQSVEAQKHVELLTTQVDREALESELLEHRASIGDVLPDLREGLDHEDTDLVARRQGAVDALSGHRRSLDEALATLSTTDPMVARGALQPIFTALPDALKNARELAADPRYALSEDDAARADQEGARLMGRLDTLHTSWTERVASAKTCDPWYVTKKNKTYLAINAWVKARLDLVERVRSLLQGTDELATVQEQDGVVTTLQVELGQADKMIRDFESPPKGSTLVEKVRTLQHDLAAQSAVAKHRPAAKAELLEAIGGIAGSIGKQPTDVLEERLATQRAVFTGLSASAESDQVAYVAGKTARDAGAKILGGKGRKAVEKTCPTVVTDLATRHEDAARRLHVEGEVVRASDDLEALRTELQTKLAGTVTPELEADEARLATEAREAAEAMAAFQGRYDALADQLKVLKERGCAGHSAHETAVLFLDQAKKAGKGGDPELGQTLLDKVAERAAYLHEHPEGPSALALSSMLGALQAYRKAAEDYRQGLAALQAAILADEVPDHAGYAVREVVSELQSLIATDVLTNDVKAVVTAGLEDRKAMLAARERSLALVRDIQSHLYGDARIRMLRSNPFLSLPLEPLARSIAELERLLLMALPLHA